MFANFFLLGSFFTTYHKHLLVAFVDCMVIDHADDSHTQVTSNTKRDAEA